MRTELKKSPVIRNIRRYMKYYLFEGVFRRPRLWSNTELKRIAPFFGGSVVNVSGATDSDKEVRSYLRYFTDQYDEGRQYRTYFSNAKEYFVTNYPKDDRRGHGEWKEAIDGNYDLDLEQPLPASLHRRFDVVFNHTTLEHVFDLFTAFANLCLMSRDIVILVVPAVQVVHDYQGAYRDYWRFTPFALDELFQRNGFTVIYRSSSKLLFTSIYYFYVASRQPDVWMGVFSPHVPNLIENLPNLNTARNMFRLARFHLLLESYLRTIVTTVLKRLKRGK